MPAPQPDNPPAAQLDHSTLIQWFDSLDKCSGWKDWLLPHLKKKLQTAENQILDAVAEGREVPGEASATVRSLRPFFTMLRDQRALTMAFVK